MRDARSSGASLVSYNAPCLHSFGRVQGYNAPISKYASFAFAAALNYLLADSNHRTQWGDATVVYWAEGDDKAAQECMNCAINPGDDWEGKLRGMMYAIAKREPIIDGASVDTLFHVLELAPNAARVSVRSSCRAHWASPWSICRSIISCWKSRVRRLRRSTCRQRS